MKIVHMRLQIPQLCEWLPAPVQAALVLLCWPPGIMNSFVCAQAVAAAEALAANTADEKALASVEAEVSLEIAESRKGARAAAVGADLLRGFSVYRFDWCCRLVASERGYVGSGGKGRGKGRRKVKGTYIWLLPCMRPDMDLQMFCLEERLPTLPDVALIPFIQISRSSAAAYISASTTICEVPCCHTTVAAAASMYSLHKRIYARNRARLPSNSCGDCFAIPFLRMCVRPLILRRPIHSEGSGFGSRWSTVLGEPRPGI